MSTIAPPSFGESRPARLLSAREHRNRNLTPATVTLPAGSAVEAVWLHGWTLIAPGRRRLPGAAVEGTDFEFIQETDTCR